MFHVEQLRDSAEHVKGEGVQGCTLWPSEGWCRSAEIFTGWLSIPAKRNQE